jgi:hypothetical protein
MPNIKTRTTAVALAVGLSLSGAAYATAASQPSGSSAVTAADTRGPAGDPGGPGGRGHGGPGGGRLDTTALAKSLGVTEDKLQAALAKVRPAKGDRDDKWTERTAAIAKALGQSTADVQAVLDANRPDPPAAGSTPPQQRPAKPDESALAKALATKFGISQDKAQAALDAAHGDRGDRRDRGDAMAAALAKDLGLDATKVRSALEAQRPSRP